MQNVIKNNSGCLPWSATFTGSPGSALSALSVSLLSALWTAGDHGECF